MFMDDWKEEKEIDVSTDEEAGYDSDQIDSDVEAELYSVIHHETDHSALNCEDSFNSLNTSDKENSSMSIHCEKFRLSNVNNEKSIQIVSPNGNSNSSLGENLTSCLQSKLFKRKSYSECVLDDIQSRKKQKNDQQNISNSVLNSNTSSLELSSSEDDNDVVRLESSNNPLFSDDNDIVCLEPSNEQLSSEDDNDIICIEPVDKLQHFETNVSQVISVDSDDSDSADSWCFKSANGKTSTPSTSKHKDLWFVNNEDLYRSRRSSNRYHESQTTCNLCNQRGHTAKFCSFSKGPKCYICGGSHSFHRCKKRICGKCLGMGHDIRYCPKEVDVCVLCHMPGHHQYICPDLWRRFQRTTAKKSKKIWRLFQDTPFFCYNCGLPGHFGAICKGRRMNTPSFPTWPFVLDYKVRKEAKGILGSTPVINANNANFSNITHSAINGQQGQVAKVKKKKKKKKSFPGAVNQQQIDFPRTPKDNIQTSPQTETTDKKQIWMYFNERQQQRRKDRQKHRLRKKRNKAAAAFEI